MNDYDPHFKNSKRSLFLTYSISSFFSYAFGILDTSAYIEWSMTKSTGHNGLILDGSPPRRFIASLIAAKSTNAGTPDRSYNITRLGLNGISICFDAFTSQFRIF